jgi:hypothetical protein
VLRHHPLAPSSMRRGIWLALSRPRRGIRLTPLLAEDGIQGHPIVPSSSEEGIQGWWAALA